ncbi:MAG: bifunctional phosphopantothenoylcysteine decarboxylase/phosphopantothenate--cysteine ligase CoaBC [Hydrotalea sp.]|nr:bifunctional phosphopantothenoylcysteine decarboxylase/phosphopantothenate--cysteine ligase CoaBC [Hydrotalea sp.]
MAKKTRKSTAVSDAISTDSTILAGRTILLIISGGISAYKSLALARLLKKSGARVIGVITAGGLQFITPLSLSALIEGPVYTDLFSLTDEQEMGHIRLARLADVIIVAPASANFIERIAHGRADDLASTILLATTAPIYMSPAMNPTMFANRQTAEHIAELKKRGVVVIDPATGDTACGEAGKGRLPEPDELFATIAAHFKKPGKLSGKKFLLTGGATREKIDRVRYISNFSSGKQAVAVARALSNEGADVTLIAGVMAAETLTNLHGVKTIRVVTGVEMEQAVMAQIARQKFDGFIAVAAVSDFRAKEMTAGKINKSDMVKNNVAMLSLTLNPDILAGVGHDKNRPALVVGFAAEVDVKNPATAQKIADKYRAKNCDMLLVNDIAPDGAPFGADATNIIFYQNNQPTDWGKLSKEEVGKLLVKQIVG